MLRKNTAGQFICFGGINATTGAALTGATFSCRRCIDGTFAAATGTITEDAAANGFYKMALSQADTNGNDLAFFFTATNAIPVTINALTTAADPSDAAGLGLTRLDASVTSRMATYTQPSGFLAATFPGGTIANTTNITAGTITNVTTVNGLAADVITAASIAAGAIGSSEAPLLANLDATVSSRMATFTLPTNFSVLSITAGGLVDVVAANLRAALGLASANLDTQLDAMPTAAENADKLLGRSLAGSADGGRTVQQALRASRNRTAIAGGTLSVYQENDTTVDWTASVTTSAGNPISEIDPA